MTNLNATHVHDIRAEERAAVRAAAAGVPEPPRRRFFCKLLAMAIGGIVVAVPAAAGLMVFLDPVRRARKNRGAAGFVPVAPLQALPAGRPPPRVPLIPD